ncbi:MAG: hypothetical protein CVV05_02510 [Gammaproteobacteria bacterium HGW-Gammaproteobacteria-1]|jgi:hypothetical protein|nr:MAG: hypothetical protein CVV05_02510 [Gammaproteobacteria bacterium HGW-Gammaproteobacteria-1]
MCMAIYAALFGLFVYYSHSLIEQYALATSTGGGEVMVVAVGWELVPLLWPVLVAAMLVASAATVWVMRRRSCCAGAK